jgi:hypothetical protein
VELVGHCTTFAGPPLSLDLAIRFPINLLKPDASRGEPFTSMSLSGQQPYTGAASVVTQRDCESDSTHNPKDIFVFGALSHAVEASTQLSSVVTGERFTDGPGSPNGSRHASSIGSDGEVLRGRRHVGVDASAQTFPVLCEEEMASRSELSKWKFLRTCDHDLKFFLTTKLMHYDEEGSYTFREPRYKGSNFDTTEKALTTLRDKRLEHVQKLHKFLKDCHAVKEETHLLHLSDTCRFSAMVFRQQAWCITWLGAHELAGWLEEYDSRE